MAPPLIFLIFVTGIALLVAIGLFVEVDWRMAWMTVGLGACIILAFAVQLAQGTSHGFIDRVAFSIGGTLLIMGVISAIFGLATVIPGSFFPG